MSGSTKMNVDDEELSEDQMALLADIRSKLPGIVTRQNKINDALLHLQQLSLTDHSPENRAEVAKYLKELQESARSQVDFMSDIKAEFERQQKEAHANALSEVKTTSQLMRYLVNRGETLPVYPRIDPALNPPPFVGGMYIADSIPLEVGDSVVVYRNNMWMLADIVWKLSASKYSLHDLYDFATPNSTFTAYRRHMQPLPKWKANPVYHPHAIFPINAAVLAYFPGTTVFYPGRVVKQPGDCEDSYKVETEDENAITTSVDVAQRYLVRLKNAGVASRQIVSAASRKNVDFESPKMKTRKRSKN